MLSRQLSSRNNVLANLTGNTKQTFEDYLFPNRKPRLTFAPYGSAFEI